MIDQLELLRCCRECGAERPPGRRSFCSTECSRLWHRRASRRRLDRIATCRVCGHPVIDPETGGRRIGAAGRPRLYCSERCKRIGRHARDLAVAPNNPDVLRRGKATGPCAICRTETRLFLDHDHSTGGIRGWICNTCNLGLGHFADDPERLRRAAAYLEA